MSIMDMPCQEACVHIVHRQGVQIGENIFMRINNIEEIRKARGMTMLELANRIGTTDSQINKLEKGQRQLDLDWIAKLCSGLNCKPHELVPEFKAFYSPKELKLLDRLSALDKEEKEILSEINKKKPRK